MSGVWCPLASVYCDCVSVIYTLYHRRCHKEGRCQLEAGKNCGVWFCTNEKLVRRDMIKERIKLMLGRKSWLQEIAKVDKWYWDDESQRSHVSEGRYGPAWLKGADLGKSFFLPFPRRWFNLGVEQGFFSCFYLFIWLHWVLLSWSMWGL